MEKHINPCLPEGYRTDYFAPLISHRLGAVTINECLKCSDSIGGSVSELYRATSDTGEPFYIKSQLHSQFPMPYVQSPMGTFQKDGKTFYLFKAYEGNICDLFVPGTELYQCWTNQWTSRQKERISAKVLLMLLFTLCECYSFRYSNLDIKPQNILYRIIDRDSADVAFIIIDIAESSTKGEYAVSDIIRLKRRGSTLWVAPALLRLFANEQMETADNDGSSKAAAYADIYSIGAIFLFLYTGKLLWKKTDITDADALKIMIHSSYRQFYFRRQNGNVFGSDSDKLETFTAGDISYAKNREGIASLICEMLSYPNTEDTSLTPESLLDSIITQYCKILKKADRLPENIVVPARYLPDDSREDATMVLIKLKVRMSGFNADKDDWEIYSEWVEYRCAHIARNSTVSIPFTVYHLYPLTDHDYRQKMSDSLFLVNDRGIIRYAFYPKADPGTQKAEATKRGEFGLGQIIESTTTDNLNGKKAKLVLTFERIRCKE